MSFSPPCFFSICFFTGLFLFSPPLFVLSSFGHYDLDVFTRIQSGSQSSVNQDTVDLSLVAGLPVVQAVTAPPINPNTGSVNTPIPSNYTTTSCTPLLLELHIDEDGCSPLTSSAGSTFVFTSSRSFQYSQIHQIDDGESVTSEVSHVESHTISSTIKQPSQTEASRASSSSPVPTTKSYSPVAFSKSPVPVSIPVSPVPAHRGKSPSPPNLKYSGLIQSPSPVSQSGSPVPERYSAELKPANPVAIPRLSSPVPKSISPVPAPNIPSLVPVPKTASPVTVPRLLSPVPKSVSPVPAPNSPSSVTAPKNASPVTVRRLSSPVPKSVSPVPVPDTFSTANVPKNASPETVPKTTNPILIPRFSSPISVPKGEPVTEIPALVHRTTYTFAGTSDSRASLVQLTSKQSYSLSPPPPDKQGTAMTDLTWPCRDQLLDDALDKLLSPDSTQLSDTHSPVSPIPGDEDRSWEEEHGIYPDFSREGTLTPMTESSWMDECFTPSTCPGTPDATLDLPTQQPSAVERLSASGQVGRSR